MGWTDETYSYEHKHISKYLRKRFTSAYFFVPSQQRQVFLNHYHTAGEMFEKKSAKLRWFLMETYNMSHICFSCIYKKKSTWSYKHTYRQPLKNIGLSSITDATTKISDEFRKDWMRLLKRNYVALMDGAAGRL